MSTNDDFDSQTVPDDPDDARDELEVDLARRAFAALVPLSPGDAALAELALEAVVRATIDARGPDDPTPSMSSVPRLVGDALARATLADAAPSAREPLGDLERLLLRLTPESRRLATERIQAAVWTVDARLRDAGYGGPA